MFGPYRVGIVGCGVAGVTTAYLLARDGHRVTLLERAPKVGPVGAGVLLQCSGQEVLRRLGVLDAVTAHAAPLDELHARHLSGSDLIRNRYPELAPGCRAYGVHRSVLFDALYRLAQSQPVDIRLGCDIVRREVASAGTTLIDSHGARHGPFDFVVVADGSRSRVTASSLGCFRWVTVCARCTGACRWRTSRA
jgi:2-polyprenyl-6-methoxyphenol hydroxylase-like FAD-dependent oxidoreductase